MPAAKGSTVKDGEVADEETNEGEAQGDPAILTFAWVRQAPRVPGSSLTPGRWQHCCTELTLASRTGLTADMKEARGMLLLARVSQRPVKGKYLGACGPK